jgi:nucleotide-binding universal stress UspA family protein
MNAPWGAGIGSILRSLARVLARPKTVEQNAPSQASRTVGRPSLQGKDRVKDHGRSELRKRGSNRRESGEAMALKNLMVHLDEAPRTQARLDIAVRLAGENDARLVGVFGQLADAHNVGVVPVWPPQAYVAAARTSQTLFERATASLRDAKWIDLNRGSDSAVLSQLTHYARHFDLVVLGQFDDTAKSPTPPETVREIVLNSGRPVLVIPYAGDFKVVGKNPLVAWNGTRESARALNDALPLIQGCAEAFVLSMAEQLEEAQTACTNALRHLGAHGIAARSEALILAESEGIGIMDLLLNRISDRSADLLVMGAQGSEFGLPFGGRGSGTRFVLQHMTAPVLMSY